MCTPTHHRFPQVQFDYQNPTPGFDRDKVKGPVAKLVRVKDMATATALEVTAGGKVRDDVEGEMEREEGGTYVCISIFFFVVEEVFTQDGELRFKVRSFPHLDLFQSVTCNVLALKLFKIPIYFLR